MDLGRAAKPEYVDNKVTAEDMDRLRRVEVELDTRWSETHIEPSLDRMERLMDLLGHPERSFASIHVAGTNGKTSTVRMIASLLQAFGRRVGATTSPHLELVTERISIDGQPISPADYCDTYEEIKPFIEMVDAESVAAGGPRMSKFEVITAIAYTAFSNAPVEVAVVEVGMGGGWDATNVIDSDVAVIMPIGLDHCDYLGDTIDKIAKEKAGIIKPRPTDDTNFTEPKDNVVIVGAQVEEAMRVIAARAVETDSAVACYPTQFAVESSVVAVGGQQLVLRGLGGVYEDIFLPLSGGFQAHNAACALAAVEAFFGAGASRSLDRDIVAEGFANATSPGRLEKMRGEPAIFVDATHNPQGAGALAAALDRDFSFRRLIGVIGILADKDSLGILSALADTFDEIVCTQPVSPRSQEAEELAAKAAEVFAPDQIHVEPDLASAIELAVSLAEDPIDADMMSGSGIVVTGSIVLAGQARRLLR